MDSTAEKAQQIVRNPTLESSRKRYKSSEDQYLEALVQAGTDLQNIDFSATRDRRKDPITVACGLILKRCGPNPQYEGLKASSTGGAIKSAVVNFWRKRGIDGEYVQMTCGGYTGNPGRCPDFQSLINSLDDTQRTGRANLTRRAYQETQEDVGKLYYTFVQPQLARAIRHDPTVDYRTLQGAIVNTLQFNAVARGDEILSLKVRDLIFTGDTINAPIIGVLPATKNKKRGYTYFKFSQQVDASFCALSAVQGWLCVLRAHNMDEGNLFVQIVSNMLQGVTIWDGTSYGRTIGEMGEEFGIEGLSEHSARRGGAGYNYFVLRRDLFFMYRAFSWDTLQEMLKYIVIEDVHNSYALLGFTAFGTNELASTIIPNY